MSDKLAMITGASSGIGASFARALAKEGYRTTLVARKEGQLRQLVEELGPSRHRFLAADLADPDHLRRVGDLFAESRYSLLVNNAGFGHYGPFGSLSPDRLQEMIAVNCLAVSALSQRFLQRAEPGAALVNVASTVGLFGLPYGALYGATKAFIISLSESLWYEERRRDVLVVALCPGVTETNFHHNAGGNDGNRPPGFMTQSPEQVAAAGLHAIRERRGPLAISGAVNKVAVLGARLFERRLVLATMGKFSPGATK